VGARDQRCAEQIGEVTAHLKAIACLEDLSEIRASIQKSAAELKTSFDRMTVEGTAVLDELRQQVSTYQTKLEEAEEIASRDLLTGLRSRLAMENLLESRIATGSAFCLAMIDIDGFKKVNDVYGHLAGDELLKQFASELKSAGRSTDVIGRWGGDEFVILLDGSQSEAGGRIDRLKKWACGDYTVAGVAGPVKLTLDASIGLTEYVKGEPIKALLARADAAMYENKGASRKEGNSRRR
jgi:diguanylate cyclase (GGDEF)-like protein